MKVIIRESAYHDLDRIYAWVAKDRPRAADAVIERLLDSAERLADSRTWGTKEKRRARSNG